MHFFMINKDTGHKTRGVQTTSSNRILMSIQMCKKLHATLQLMHLYAIIAIVPFLCFKAIRHSRSKSIMLDYHALFFS